MMMWPALGPLLKLASVARLINLSPSASALLKSDLTKAIAA